LFLEGGAEEDAVCKFASFLVPVLMVYSAGSGSGVSHGLQTIMMLIEGAF